MICLLLQLLEIGYTASLGVMHEKQNVWEVSLIRDIYLILWLVMLERDNIQGVCNMGTYETFEESVSMTYIMSVGLYR